jgi:hypothetical protein
MAALLAERAAAVDPMAVSYVVSDRRAELISRQLARPLPVGTRLRLRVMAAVELVNAGRIEDGLRALEALESDARQNQPEYWRQHESSARMLRATAYLRMAEDQNCHRSTRDATEPLLSPGPGVRRCRRPCASAGSASSCTARPRRRGQVRSRRGLAGSIPPGKQIEQRRETA